MTPITYAEFEAALQRLIGLDCSNVSAGAVGSLASLDFGARVPRSKPLPYPNVSLTPDEHKFRGEYVLFLEDCPWRLDGADAVIASWTDSSAPGGPIVSGLRQLVGRPVQAVELSYPGLDLVIRFSGGYTLKVFPDQSDPDAGDNYSLLTAEGTTLVVAARSTVYCDE